MERRLIIDGSAVYELDETCMLKKKFKQDEKKKKEYPELNRAKELGRHR